MAMRRVKIRVAMQGKGIEGALKAMVNGKT